VAARDRRGLRAPSGPARARRAIDTLLAPLALLAPPIVGGVADAAGLEAALLVLLAQPLVVALVALGHTRRT
jgi:hypothetical protein